LEGDESKPEDFFWKNGMFSYSDAMSYYAMIRKYKPKTIIEVGSGFSTLVALKGIERNQVGKVICIEPFPTVFLRNLKGIELVEKKAQELSDEFFNQELSDGDFLFIDSTHTVKSGSDCLHLYLRVLPRLRPELFIHAHDIFLPFPLPLDWALNRHIYWTEQYLLLGYMIGNDRCKVILGSSFAEHKLPNELRAFMHNYYPGGGGSLWLSHKSLR
jgi:hypothetical protein